MKPSYIVTLFCILFVAIAAPIQSQQKYETEFVMPGEVDALEVVTKTELISIQSGKCAMALLKAVYVNNTFHHKVREADFIQDRTIGQGSHITYFDCYADPDGRDYFYLELSISLDKDTIPISKGGLSSVTRYFTFNLDGTLQGWLL